MDRGAHDEAVGRRRFLDELVAGVAVEHAAVIALLPADATGDAAADLLVADPGDLRLHALGLKGRRGLL